MSSFFLETGPSARGVPLPPGPPIPSPARFIQVDMAIRKHTRFPFRNRPPKNAPAPCPVHVPSKNSGLSGHAEQPAFAEKTKRRRRSLSVSRPSPLAGLFTLPLPGRAAPAGFPLKLPSDASFTRRTFR